MSMTSSLHHFLNVKGTGRHFLIRQPRHNAPFTPDGLGMWEHPDFRWALVPEDMDVSTFFADAGYELHLVRRGQEETALDDWDDDNACLGWTPSPPTDDGFGWFLVFVAQDAEGPFAAFARFSGNAYLTIDVLL